MDIKNKQAGVQARIAAGFLFVILVSVLCVQKQPFKVSGDDRVALWLKWNLPKAACCWYFIFRIGNFRFVSPVDIDGAASPAPPSAQLRVMQAILQNTLEQAVLAALVQGAFAVLAPEHWLLLLPLANVFFVAGRCLFAAGYKHGAPSRALGMTFTYMPTTLMMAACCWLLVAPAGGSA